MSAVAPIKLSRSENPGGLVPGALPGVDGWYWCQCEGYAAPEVVYVIAPGNGADRSPGKALSMSGEYRLIGSRYDSDKANWFGPISPPAGWDRPR